MNIASNLRRPLLATALFLAACAASGPGAALEKYLKTVEAGDVKLAAAMFPKSVRAQFESKIVAMIGRQSEDIRKRGGIKAMDIVQEQVTGELASVRVATHYGDGTVDTTSTQMLREEREWKINPR